VSGRASRACVVDGEWLCSLRDHGQCLHSSDISSLGSSLTIRLNRRQLVRLRARARAEGMTPSAVVRAVLDRELAESDVEGQTVGERSRRWVGAIRSVRAVHGCAEREATEAWDPDRRG
jgi:hypothetical protein